MTKEELVKIVTDNSLKLIGISEQADDLKTSVGIKSYIANILEQSETSVSAKNIAFYVVDEGKLSETAYFRDEIKKISVRQGIESYLASLSSAILSFDITSVNEEKNTGKAKIIIVSTGECVTEKEIFIYQENGEYIYKTLV